MQARWTLVQWCLPRMHQFQGGTRAPTYTTGLIFSYMGPTAQIWYGPYRDATTNTFDTRANGDGNDVRSSIRARVLVHILPPEPWHTTALTPRRLPAAALTATHASNHGRMSI